jgi:hypothetical protein
VWAVFVPESYARCRRLGRWVQRLERVDHHGQPRGVGQQGRELLPPPAAGVGHPHRVLPRPLQGRPAPGDGPAGGRVGHPEQEPEHLVRRVLPQPDHGQQHLIDDRQVERIPAPDRPLPVGPVELPAAGRLDRRDDDGGQVVEHRGGDPGQVPEHGRVLPQVGQPGDHGGIRRSGETAVRIRTPAYRE